MQFAIPVNFAAALPCIFEKLGLAGILTRTVA